ncbi:DVU_1556 family methyltransferase [Anoxynatronum buryatiense]|uniref:Methyltransferase domain-containing protein n=1 Tax=Anoxynatronum buryatiense TaxID=489973 RepID=A0AA45WV96_9CLOT|nr:class I SAM-dependent methyltransferase [Anoxynatronum buryatiense]SMP51880.1 Methyltransferase domain-containing protein [Anoxynatronum buryatiense]
MKCCNVYENDAMKEAMGETLRPGGFSLTEKGVVFCGFSAKDSILDVGCGRGATVGYLSEKHAIQASGIDPSEKLLADARQNHPGGHFVTGKGESLPFKDESFHGVFAECTLSLMDNVHLALKEASRVLKPKGWLIITDVYAKRPAFINELEAFSFNSCMRGLHDVNLFEKNLKALGFSIAMKEDCSELLKSLLVNIILTHGSMGAFWSKTTDQCTEGHRFQAILQACKPGYFMIIGRKGEIHHE